jgi:hypothetical protein
MFKILNTYSCWKKYIKCNIWRVAVRSSFIYDARFLKVNVGLQIGFEEKYRLQVHSQCHYIYIRLVYTDKIVILDRSLGIISQGVFVLLLFILARCILLTVPNSDTHQSNQISTIIFSSLVSRQNKKLKLSLSTPWRHIGGVVVLLHLFVTP